MLAIHHCALLVLCRLCFEHSYSIFSILHEVTQALRLMFRKVLGLLDYVHTLCQTAAQPFAQNQLDFALMYV